MAVARVSQSVSGDSRSFPTAAIAVAIFVLTIAVFGRACLNGFVNYDDNDYVTANEQVQAGLTRDGIAWAMRADVASNWHPLTWMSHMLDVSLFGRDARGHHATSVLLHALNAALLFVALRRLTGRLSGSVVCALAFALHPLRVESVAWVAERKDVLSGLFFMLTLLGYAAYVGRRRNGDAGWLMYGVTMVTFGLGLMAKPMLVTLPCLLLVLDYWPLRRFGGAQRTSLGGLLLEKLPLLALALASSAVTYRIQHASGAVTGALSVGARVANALVSVPRYVGKVLWPSKLAVLYLHPGAWPALAVAAAVLFIALVSWLMWTQRRARPWLLVGWLWFIGLLVPVSGIVQVGLQSMADRYTYLPSIGLELAAAWLALELLGAASWRAIAACVGAIALLAVGQIGYWKDSVALFTHTIAVARRGNYLAYDNRGVALNAAGKIDAAVADYEQALALNPDYPNANNNLARILAERGKLPEAIALYRRALQAKPDKLEIRNNLGNALSDAGAIDEAIEQYRFVLQRAPKHVNARNGYAGALAAQGKLAEAERELNAVLETAPDDLSALSNLGNVYAMTGRREQAAALYRRSLAVKPDDPRTLGNLGNVMLELGQLDAAVENYRRAVQVAPTNPDAHAMLGFALLRLGRRAEAEQELQTALRQRPNFPQAQAWLAAARGAR